MARKALIDDDALLGRLGDVFRELGYEGASLAKLAHAAGLRKASLYHRFPGGKEQMGHEVLARASQWLEHNIVTPLVADGHPADRLESVIASLDAYYSGGRQGCLLNLLSSPVCGPGPFRHEIAAMLSALIGAFARLAIDAGHDAEAARDRAEEAVALIQGGLVLARGFGDPAPFRHVLAALPDRLLGPSGKSGAPKSAA